MQAPGSDELCLVPLEKPATLCIPDGFMEEGGGAGVDAKVSLTHLSMLALLCECEYI